MITNDSQKKKIFVVDDERDIVSILKKSFSDEEYLVHGLSDGEAAVTEAARLNPDLIVLDVKMPGMDGYQVKSELNKNPATAKIPVIFLSASDTTEDKIIGLKLGADDYVTKPFNVQELLARIGTVLNRRQHYEDLSMTDALTNLPNAQYFKRELSVAFDRAKRYGRVFSVGFIDIDRFKEINDTFGHLTGDAVIKEAAKRMEETIRTPDVLARYGGDEFCMILQEASQEQARVALYRLKNGVEGRLFEGPDGEGEFPLSISVGMVTYKDSINSAEELIELADQNMYKNKKKIYRQSELKKEDIPT